MPKHQVTSLVMLLLLLSLGGFPLARPSTQPLAQYSVTIRVLDESPQVRLVSNASVTITRVDVNSNVVIEKVTASNGEVTELLDEGTYNISATSPVALYGKAAQSITNSTRVYVPLSSASVELRLPICDARIELLSPSGVPLPGAGLVVDGVYLGETGSSFTVTASMYGQDISPTVPLVVTASATFTVTATSIAQLRIQVVNALDQGLAEANVMVSVRAATVFTGATDDHGTVSLELPYGLYYITTSYKGVEVTKTLSLAGDATEKMETGIFVVLLGQPLTLVSFIFWVVIVLLFLLVMGFFVLRHARK
jgi:hypothetical protein